MNTKMIIGLVAILVIAAAAYMFASGNLQSAAPSTQATEGTTTTVADSVGEAAATSAATDAESAVGGTADEISSADALEIPDV